MKPRCLALMMCEGVHKDPGTGKLSLLGIFNSLPTKQFPFTVSFWVYVCLTDIRQPTPIGIRMTHTDLLGGGESTLEFTGIADLSDPLGVVHITRMANVTFHLGGTHLCELFSGDDLLMSQRITVDGPAA